MPLLSYNCLNKLNLCPMHIFRFQRTWFYPADLGCPHPGYQTRSAIKRTLRHSRRGGIWEGEKRGFRGRFQRFKKYILRALRAQQGREESQRGGICPISLRSFKIPLSLQRNICQNMHTSDITFSHKNPPHLTILEGNAQAKPLGLEFQIPQVMCKSTKSIRIGTRILVTESFS